MWAGRTIVASRIPPLEWLVGDAGLLVDTREEAAAALLALTDHVGQGSSVRERRCAYGSSCRSTFRGKRSRSGTRRSWHPDDRACASAPLVSELPRRRRRRERRLWPGARATACGRRGSHRRRRRGREPRIRQERRCRCDGPPLEAALELVARAHYDPGNCRPASQDVQAFAPDVIHAHGEFNPDNFWALRIAGRGSLVVLSPQGAFDPGVFRKSRGGRNGCTQASRGGSCTSVSARSTP